MKSCSPKRRAERLVWVERDGPLHAVRIAATGVALVTLERADVLAGHLRRILAREFRRAERRGARRALKRAAKVLHNDAVACKRCGSPLLGGVIQAITLIEALAAELGKRKGAK